MVDMNFEGFVQDIIDNSWNVHGVEVYKSGKLAGSYGDTIGTRYDIYSATKAITSIATGMAYDEGKIKLDDNILKYIPDKHIIRMSASQLEAYRHITIERLLTMSVKGYPFRPEGDCWLDFSLGIPLSDTNVREFDYSNISAYLVCVALANAVNEDLYDYLSRKLFIPLGIDNPPFERCPEGYFYGASKMKLSVNELSKIGLMLYNKGVFDGKRLLSEEYVGLATSARQITKDGGYGYFFWKYRDGFSINGKWKQKCYILPKEELVITYLCDIKDDNHDLIKSMEKNILVGE